MGFSGLGCRDHLMATARADGDGTTAGASLVTG